MPADPTSQKSSDQLLRQACAELDRRLRAGEPARAEEYLSSLLGPTVDVSTALELLYAEFVAREELGQQPTPEEWYRRFPQWRQDLQELFQIHELMRESVVAALPGTPPPTEVAAPGGRQLGHFELLEEVGRGGMGVVYKARDRKLNRIVALKVIAPASESGSVWSRFVAEAEAAACLQHPHIVAIHEIGASAGTPYLSLEFVEGGNLGRQCRRQPQEVRRAAQLVEALARAAHYAHQRGVVHRDLKPANVLLTQEGMPKITDFGLAQLRRCTAGASEGAIQGTPGYMAPEQLTPSANAVGPSTDIYSLGAILYDLLTGRPPGEDAHDLEALLLRPPQLPPPPSRRRRSVPRDLDAICLHCLEPEPARRYPDAGALAEDLRRFLGGEPVQARRTPAWERCWMWAKRRPALAALVVVSVLAVLGLIGGALQYHADLRAALYRAERAQAETEQHARDLQEQLRYSRHGLYALQLSQVDALWPHDPGHGRRLLQDPHICPPDLRDFTWGYYYRLCQRERLTLRSQSDSVSCLAFSPDGQTLATAGGNLRNPDDQGLVQLWHLATGQERTALKGHAGPVNAVAFSPDGRTLAAAAGYRRNNPRGEVRLWEVATGRVTHIQKGHAGGVLAVAFSPDGGTLATGGADGTVRLWDAVTGREKATFAQVAEIVQCLAFAPDGQTLAAGGGNRAVTLWNLNTGRRSTIVPGHQAGLLSLAFSPDGNLLATGNLDRTAILWDLASASQKAVLKGHTNAVQCVAFGPDGKTLATSSLDCTIKLWDVGAGRETTTLKGHDTASDWVAFAPDGRLFASASRAGEVKVWDTVAATQRNLLHAHSGKVLCAAFSRDNKTLVTGSQDASVKLWDHAGRPRASLSGHRRAVRAVAFHPDGRLLATGDEGNTVRLWDLTDNRESRTLEAHTHYIAALAFAPDGRTLATGSFDHTVRIWDPLTGRLRATRPDHASAVHALAYAPDGRALATAGEDGVVRLWDTESWQVQASLPPQPRPVLCLGYHPGGNILATGCKDHTIRLWDLTTLRETLVLKGHTHWVYSLAFSGDGRTLASASGDRYANAPGEVKLWDTVTGHIRATFPGQVAPVVFAPNGCTLLTANQDGTVNLLQAARD